MSPTDPHAVDGQTLALDDTSEVPDVSLFDEEARILGGISTALEVGDRVTSKRFAQLLFESGAPAVVVE